MTFQVMPRAELIDYLEEHERRNEALFDRIDRRLGAIEDRILANPPPPNAREDEEIEVEPPPRKAGRKTDGVLKVCLIICRFLSCDLFVTHFSPSNASANTLA